MRRLDYAARDGDSFLDAVQNATVECGHTAGFYYIGKEPALVFDTGVYFRDTGVEAFYPHVGIDFEVRDPAQHYHVPLLLSPFGYSTYRGS